METPDLAPPAVACQPRDVLPKWYAEGVVAGTTDVLDDVGSLVLCNMMENAVRLTIIVTETESGSR